MILGSSDALLIYVFAMWNSYLPFSSMQILLLTSCVFFYYFITNGTQSSKFSTKKKMWREVNILKK